MELITDQQLAQRFGVTVEKLHELRLKNDWPCVRLGRFEFRFTEAQVEQIVASHSESPSTSKATRRPKPAMEGQTSRSARRTRAG